MADHHHGHEVRVAVAAPDDWRVVRHLRLGALADEPDAFGATLDEEVPLPESSWRDGLAGDYTTLLASWVGDDGEARPAGLCARHGFTRTGRTGSLPAPRTDVTEHELGRDL